MYKSKQYRKKCNKGLKRGIRKNNRIVSQIKNNRVVSQIEKNRIIE